MALEIRDTGAPSDPGHRPVYDVIVVNSDESDSP